MDGYDTDFEFRVDKISAHVWHACWNQARETRRYDTGLGDQGFMGVNLGMAWYGLSCQEFLVNDCSLQL